MPQTATKQTIRTVFSVRVTDRATGTDHLVDDGRYTVAKLTGHAPVALCSVGVEPASLVHPHGVVCDDCAQIQAARKLQATEQLARTR